MLTNNFCTNTILNHPNTPALLNYEKQKKKVNILYKGMAGIFIGRTDAEAEAPILLATWCKKLTH